MLRPDILGRRSVRVLRLSALLIALGLLPLAAAEKLPPLSPYKTDIPPVIDGILDDSAWKLAPTETGFKTYYPDFGKDMQEKTIVYYTYDRENLYFAFRCLDSKPDKIKASVSARDTIRPDDWIASTSTRSMTSSLSMRCTSTRSESKPIPSSRGTKKISA